MPLDRAVIRRRAAHDTIYKETLLFTRLEVCPQCGGHRQGGYADVAGDGPGHGFPGSRFRGVCCRRIAVEGTRKQNGQSKANGQCSHGVKERRDRDVEGY